MAVWYRVGTVSVTQGSPTVTGNGTVFTSVVREGDMFTVDENIFYEIAAVVSDTQLTLTKNYAQDTQSNISYTIIPLSPRRFLASDLGARVDNLIVRYRDKFDAVIVTADEINALDNVTSNVQTQLNSKVTGPASAVNGNLPVFDGTTGKVIKDSGISVVSGTSILYQGIRRVPSLTEPIGVALVQPGGGAGVWDRVDLNGNPIMVPPGYFSSRPEYQLNITNIDSQSMVNIDKFHYLRKTLSSGPYAGKEAWFVNKTAFTGSAVHPAFLNTGGSEIDKFYVGAYEAFDDGGTKAGSQNNKAPLVSIDFPTMVARCEARNVDPITGFSLINIYQIAAIQYLALVEMGAPDAQTILGRGNVDSSTGSAMNTGYTNAIWRALHELWGNVWCMVQGIQQTNGQLQIWKNDGSQTFVDTGVTLPNNGYIATMSNATGTGFNLSALFIPATVGSGSWGAYFWIAKSDTTKVCYHGGSWYGGSSAGLFSLNLYSLSSYLYTYIGGRLAKV